MSNHEGMIAPSAKKNGMEQPTVMGNQKEAKKYKIFPYFRISNLHEVCSSILVQDDLYKSKKQ